MALSRCMSGPRPPFSTLPRGREDASREVQGHIQVLYPVPQVLSSQKERVHRQIHMVTLHPGHQETFPEHLRAFALHSLEKQGDREPVTTASPSGCPHQLGCEVIFREE